MQVHYDRTLKIAGLGVVPWTRAGLEQWFDSYRIISFTGWDVAGVADAPPVYYPHEDLHLKALKMSQVVKTDWYRKLVADEFAGYKLLPYKPLLPASLPSGNTYLMADDIFTTTYENKAWLRQTFGDSAFAPHHIVDRAELDGRTYDDIRGEWDAIVMQHEQLSGGRGTHIVRDANGYGRACAALPAGMIVISKFIDGARERSVQAVVTRHGVLYGPAQKQVIGNPLLTKLDVKRPSLFCGAELGTVELTEAQRHKVDAALGAIGERMRLDGYKGIFGADLLVTEEDVYMVEINARLTGVTPLHTMFAGGVSAIPFYLLHALELSDADYSVEGMDEPHGQAGMLLIHDLGDGVRTLEAAPSSGIYSIEGGTLELIRADYRFRDEDKGTGRVLLQQYVPVGSIIKPGARLMTMFTDGPILDETDMLLTEVEAVVKAVRAAISTIPAKTAE